jgi:hypothetical protein
MHGTFRLALCVTGTLAAPVALFAAQDPPLAQVREVLDWNIGADAEKHESCRVFFADLNEDDVNEMIVVFPVMDRQVARVRVSRWKDDKEQVVFEHDSETLSADVGLVNGAPQVIVDRYRPGPSGGPQVLREEPHLWDGYRFSHNPMEDCTKAPGSPSHCVRIWNPMPSRACTDFPH